MSLTVGNGTDLDRIVNIAFLQLLPGKTLEEQLKIGQKACREAKEKGADIALFPEMWSDGYYLPQDENELKKYMNVNCASTQLGVYPVKQYAPNAFGLYDVYGNAEEYSLYFPYKSNNRISEATAMECFQYNSSGYSIGQSCEFLKKHVCRANRSSRPQWLYGMRLVRKLE